MYKKNCIDRLTQPSVRETWNKIPVWLKIGCTYFLFVLVLFEKKILLQQPCLPCNHLTLFFRQHSDPKGLTNVVQLFGLTSFGLSFIDAVRLRKFRGILMEHVIEEMYPYYGGYYILHALFISLCLYCCGIQLWDISLLCTIGAIICTIYTVRMSVNIVFSRQKREKLFSKYILNYVDRTRKTMLNAVPNGKSLYSEEQIQHICSIANYIGNQFQKREWFLSNKADNLFSKDGDVFQLLRLTAVFQENEPSDKRSLIKSCPFYIKGLTSDEMEQFQYSMFCASDGLHRFQSEILAFGEMWQSMLEQLDTAEKQARLIYRILEVAKDRWLPTALCCGLIHYFGSSEIAQYKQKTTLQCCCEIALFLLKQELVNRSSEQINDKVYDLDMDNTGEKSDKLFFLTICIEICLISYYYDILHGNGEYNSTDFALLQKDIHTLLWYADFEISLYQNAGYYLWYAYAVEALIDNVDKCTLHYLWCKRKQLLDVWLKRF